MHTDPTAIHATFTLAGLVSPAEVTTDASRPANHRAGMAKWLGRYDAAIRTSSGYIVAEQEMVEGELDLYVTDLCGCVQATMTFPDTHLGRAMFVGAATAAIAEHRGVWSD